MDLKDKLYFLEFYIKTKINNFFDNINEWHLTWLICLVTGLITYLAYQYGDANLQEMSNRSLKLSAFLLYAVSIIKYQGTKKLDTMKEIIQEHNIAYAIVIGSLLLGGVFCLII